MARKGAIVAVITADSALSITGLKLSDKPPNLDFPVAYLKSGNISV